MNTPYVKQYDELGICINPIKTEYKNEFPNRRERRENKNEKPFFGCGKNIPLTVTPTGKYKRVRQHETEKDGTKKVIEHYILQ